MSKKILWVALLIIIIIALFSITNIKTEKRKETEIYLTGIDLTYLDDTEISEDVYAVSICAPKD